MNVAPLCFLSFLLLLPVLSPSSLSFRNYIFASKIPTTPPLKSKASKQTADRMELWIPLCAEFHFGTSWDLAACAPKARDQLGPAGKSHFTVPGPWQILHLPVSRREGEKGRDGLRVLCRPARGAAHPCSPAPQPWGSQGGFAVLLHSLPRIHLLASSPHLLQQRGQALGSCLGENPPFLRRGGLS